MAERFDRIWHNARLATMCADRPDLGEIEHGLIAARGGHIVYAGAEANFPADADAIKRIDCEGRWITPGLVDCHTHLVYGGNRAHEFELRLKGASYEDRKSTRLNSSHEWISYAVFCLKKKKKKKQTALQYNQSHTEKVMSHTTTTPAETSSR